MKCQRPRGTYDIIGKDFQYFDRIFEVCQKQAQFYGFERIETPIFEDAEIFNRGVGAGTDIVEKEMYLLKGEGEQVLALRPEATASIARAYIENGLTNLPKPVKLWCFGTFFRHEKPQAGRFRQFWQVDFEALGRKSPVIDVEIIQLFYSIFQKLGLKNLMTHVNSIGCPKCRGRYIKTLKSYLKSYQSNLCRDCRRRLKTNPLRVLDCKKEKCEKVLKESPQILDSLCKKCRAHLKEVLELLEALEIPYRLDPYLVRGLDYYNRTVFEIFFNKENKEEGKVALVGGGRYDDLVKILGGVPTPACGGAAGVERLISLLKEQEIKLPQEEKPNIFLAQLGESAKGKALQLFEELRRANILTAEDLSRDSLRVQLARANRLGVKYVLILGQKEVIENEVILRDMENKTQESIKMEKVVSEIKKKLKS